MYFAFDQTTFWVTLILIAALMGAIQGICAYLILAERKISAWAQDRVGPNRVGWEFGLPFGLLQPIADGVKFLIKEQVIPGGVDKLFYLGAPCIAIATALMAIAVVPFGATSAAPVMIDYRDDAHKPIWPTTLAERKAVLDADKAHAQATGEKTFEEKLKTYNAQLQFVIAPHMDIAVVYVLAVGSLGAYALILAGWSSNNKYSMLGSLRSSAQLISYEIPMGLSVLGVMVATGSLNVERIVQFQVEHGWNILFQPLAALLFVTCIFAECNRLPFDLPEAEQELVGGYHTEYSGMKFALFFLGEYTHMVTTSLLAVALFFGGWHLPGLTGAETAGWGDMALKVGVFAFKMVLFIIFYMFIRWTIPRFRFDQLMGLAWKVMIPLALASVVAVIYVKHFGLSPWLLLVASVAIVLIGTVLSLRLPRRVGMVRVVLHGHPVTGTRETLAE